MFAPAPLRNSSPADFCMGHSLALVGKLAPLGLRNNVGLICLFAYCRYYHSAETPYNPFLFSAVFDTPGIFFSYAAIP